MMTGSQVNKRGGLLRLGGGEEQQKEETREPGELGGSRSW